MRYAAAKGIRSFHRSVTPMFAGHRRAETCEPPPAGLRYESTLRVIADLQTPTGRRPDRSDRSVTRPAGATPVSRSANHRRVSVLSCCPAPPGPGTEKIAPRRQGLHAFGRAAPASRIPRPSIVPGRHAGEHRPVRGHDRRGGRHPRNAGIRKYDLLIVIADRRDPEFNFSQASRRPSSISSGRATVTSRSTAPTTPPRIGSRLERNARRHFLARRPSRRQDAEGLLHGQDRRHQQPDHRRG